ncbi:hypothetical protein [Phytomonospora endophytica]|uniref:Integral membrane protein n=1 Tax=Phytomonospora endophytica TaxID=714109 RepID=A0A841FA42_9ACTN|nr:hypothetical protein [Phytomonospora endophytica]MBB6032614.1 hypothetical protein [Phytomonospora endophytica]GIG66236.1 integral membrane protein [Phytomonospora endophytica]
MHTWFRNTIVEPGLVPLFSFFVAMLVGFGFIRLSVRLIRAKVRWWPGNVTPGGLHIHHVVFGVVFMLIGGVAGLTVPEELVGWRSVMAALFGIGAALVLDEFALILHLKDVYWTEEGRTSVDALFVAIALTGLLLLGFRPIGVADTLDLRGQPYSVPLGIAFTLLNLGFAAVTLLKGKIWSGLLGLLVPLFLYVGAVRLARPGSPWARWRYRPDRRRGERKMANAVWREMRLRRPIIRGKIWLQELIAGRHD